MKVNTRTMMSAEKITRKCRISHKYCWFLVIYITIRNIEYYLIRFLESSLSTFSEWTRIYGKSTKHLFFCPFNNNNNYI